MTDGASEEPRARTSYQPDGQSLRVLLGAMAVGAVLAVGVVLAILLL